MWSLNSYNHIIFIVKVIEILSTTLLKQNTSNRYLVLITSTWPATTVRPLAVPNIWKESKLRWIHFKIFLLCVSHLCFFKNNKYFVFIQVYVSGFVAKIFTASMVEIMQHKIFNNIPKDWNIETPLYRDFFYLWNNILPPHIQRR